MHESVFMRDILEGDVFILDLRSDPITKKPRQNVHSQNITLPTEIEQISEEKCTVYKLRQNFKKKLPLKTIIYYA